MLLIRALFQTDLTDSESSTKKTDQDYRHCETTDRAQINLYNATRKRSKSSIYSSTNLYC